MPTTDEALARAAQHYQMGEFAQAEQLCRQILQAEPAHAYALHLLGVLAFQARRWDESVGYCSAALRLRPDLAEVHNSLGAALTERQQYTEALRCFQEALRLRPDYADAHNNQGTIFKHMGQWQQAEASYRTALRFRPDFPQAHSNLGGVLALQGRLAEAVGCYQAALRYWPDFVEARVNLGNVLTQMGRLEEAEGCYRAALRLRPDLADIHSTLGAILTERGQFAAAMESLRESLRLWPALAEGHTNLGNLLKRMGRPAEAEGCYREALRHGPSLPQAHNNLGLLLLEQGRLAEALASFQEAVRVWANYPDAHANLGDTLKRLGRWDEAVASYRTALRIRPYFTQAHNNLGVLLAVQRKYAESEQIFRDAVRLWPRSPEPCYNLGIALAAQEKPDEALACYEQALRLKPDYAEALNNTAFICREQGRIDEAIAYSRKAIAIRPDLHYLYSNLLLALHYPASYDPEATFAEHLRWAEQGAGVRGQGSGVRGKASSLTPDPWPLTPADLHPQRRLRIGYVSGDFKEHVMGRYSEAVIAAHDRSQFEVFCYANIRKEDAFSQRIKTAADHWRPLIEMSDGQAAQLIREDQIDVLIDLAGHTADNRVTVFAQKPAPVQVTHCGYPDTTGLAAIDYRLTDPYCDPPGRTERWHSEQVVRLPEAHWCYAPPPTPEVAPLPAQQPGAVTFASFNLLGKVTEQMMGLWAQILQALPQARLMVQTGAGRAGDARVRAAFARHGIGEERVTLVGRLPSEAYYRRYGEVDICLDTHPYAGCNTTADALWMGVPVVTLAGPTCVTRLGVSAIVLAGLVDLVTETPDAYVETAVRLANDLPRLRELRGQLRDRVKRTLGNVERFTRQLEAAYRNMWRSYCAQASGGRELPEASSQEPLHLRTDREKAYLELGNRQMRAGRAREAEASYREGLHVRPTSADLLCNLGSALTEQERFAEAEACYREALRLAPDYPETHYNLGLNYAAQGKPDEAVACYEQALRVKGDFADGLYRLGATCYEQGLLDQALGYYRKALALRPDDQATQSSLLLLSHYFADYDPQASFTEHRAWAGQFGEIPAQHRPRRPVEHDPERRLRIGYVSPDFREHVMGRYSEAVVAPHDRSRFEVFCYANVRQEDERTQRIKAAADHWRSVVGIPDDEMAEMLLDDRIDLLIDLAGHTGGNRLRVLARKAAPVQVTHCGYPAGTGLAAIDYRLTDPYCDPPGRTERFHIEQVVRLPDAHWCYAPPPTPEVGPLPAREPGAVTFASFNILPKVTEPMIALWTRILQALPRARMMVQTGAGRAGDARVRAAFARHGIGEERVTLAARLPSEAYYRRYGEVDICLDTYPYTGCNTTADALWMGVPVITRAGPTCVTRLGVSALVLAGLEDLVTETPDAYVEIAVRLARDLPRLRELRGQLRDRVKRTLGNVPRFTRQLEAVYRDMWRTYCGQASR